MLKPNFSGNVLECGSDEAGRGCLAGPVTAAAVIFSENYSLKDLNDSKLISEKLRKKLTPKIELDAISFAITHIDPQVIDNINILNASILAMHESIIKLTPAPEFIIIDGNRFKPLNNISLPDCLFLISLFNISKSCSKFSSSIFSWNSGIIDRCALVIVCLVNSIRCPHSYESSDANLPISKDLPEPRPPVIIK